MHPWHAGYGRHDCPQIGAGHSVDEILADYPYLEREDIMQGLRYAAWRTEEREVALAGAWSCWSI